ncbi:tRNA 4-thiouridine(8) synthase ThiI [Clostridium sp. AF18-27]|uniref:tRNA uracil 4-sulfurtransferase ThiI n=1 Tax=Enterocloster TaxID=2719313 RepID=UPI000D1A5950|nr:MULTISPECIES: tRNA uracil 4-sulfurtransferase ThiI [Enterocloster]MBS5604760.1 tRNA 4-thiouridine(8) synthase ThiI [Enterocloster asparagiformis]RHR46477.1 tRNA 4-thiouridine(8) synthase ThiI [Clostridium sp. AF18-27]MCB6343323.1 tRNA 4-thiouridine(8) synthase ThiI [Enterocloster lavalensis]MDR3759039.1 tRNA uracil 4-sulfurtransferase ThiI [Enterocloster sp.]PST34294.1 tRNA 4-thiouridine(8) synthase ThiI [Enterocloster lavalensis]
MKYQSFLIKYAEIGTKGKNRFMFEDALIKQIRYALKSVEGRFEVTKESGRIYVMAEGDYEYDDVIEALKRVFGIADICPMVQIEDKDYENLKKRVVEYMDQVYPDKRLTFKVNARRGDKNYPVSSDQINRDLGEVILEAFPEMKVDVHNPDVILRVEVRQKVNLFSLVIPGPGGMPVGTNGRAMLLLSGGIDSPVAGYMIAKRGVKIDAVYFHAPPYTSDRAKQKVVDLANLVARYAGPINLYVVNFTDIQLYIYDKCPHEELTIIMRRYMMRIAEAIANQTGAISLITGESIGQVASQTVQSLAATNEVCTMPVFRPVIGFDKQEIVDLSEKIGTFETSIQPFEDCCTIFVAKHPVTKPNLNVIRGSETHLQEKIGEMVQTAIDTAERITCQG